MANNPYLTESGIEGVPIPSPLATDKGYSPALYEMAADRAQAAQNNVSQVFGQKGMLDSSAYGAGLQRAYMDAFDRVVSEYQQQQSMYNQWSRDLMAMKAAQGPEPEELEWWEEALGGAISGASLGASLAPTGSRGMGAGIGALAGAGVGLLTDLF
jgi:hypothetical protein